MQSSIIEFLSKPSAYGFEGGRVDKVQTHISYIFLVGDKAYKLKRAIKLPYLDFSTLELRRQACENEVKLNRRTAPEIYIGVKPVTKNAAGELAIDGAGDVVDWLVEMKRFEDDKLLSTLAEKGLLTRQNMADLAVRIFEFHNNEPAVKKGGGAAQLKAVIESNAECFREYGTDIFEAGKIKLLNSRLQESLTQHAKLLNQRMEDGKVRHCHGDLHLGNLVLLEEGPILFDAIEFSDDLATIDTMYDLGFLIMDLTFRGLKAEASLLLDRYMAVSADYSALALLPIFLSVRASIRAHVAALAGEKVSAESYLDFALTCLEPVPPRLIAIGGLSGSGKSSVARCIAPDFPPLPGALILRSDVIRKHLAGVDQYTKLAEAHYSLDMTRRTYDHMYELAKLTLKAGHSVVVDAVFAQPNERAAIQKIAEAAGVTFKGIWLEVPLSIAEKRIAGRTKDASDATVEILKSQLAYDIGSLDWHRIENSADLEKVTQAVAEICHQEKNN